MILVINNFIAYKGAFDIRGRTVVNIMAAGISNHDTDLVRPNWLIKQTRETHSLNKYMKCINEASLQNAFIKQTQKWGLPSTISN